MGWLNDPQIWASLLTLTALEIVLGIDNLVFITDARFGDRFTELRKEIFGDNFPASALITVAGLARPEMLVEVQGVAVLRSSDSVDATRVKPERA